MFIQMARASRKETKMKKCPKCETMYAEEDGRGGVCGRCYTNSRGGSMERDMDWLRQAAGQQKSDRV